MITIIVALLLIILVVVVVSGVERQMSKPHTGHPCTHEVTETLSDNRGEFCIKCGKVLDDASIR